MVKPYIKRYIKNQSLDNYGMVLVAINWLYNFNDTCMLAYVQELVLLQECNGNFVPRKRKSS